MSKSPRKNKAELLARLKKLEARSIRARTRHARDMSAERKRSQSALDESAARLRAILETAVEGIITIDERGRIESMNPAAERAFGYRAAEVLGRNVNILMPSPYREEHDGYLENYVHTGRAKIIGIGREVTARRKDGSTFPIDLSVSEVPFAGRRIFAGFIRDITQRKELEKSLLHYAAIVESSDDAIISKTLEGLVTTWNSGAERIFGFKREEMMGQNISRLIPSDRLHEEADILRRIRSGEAVDHFETVRLRKDGERIDVSVTISPIRQADGRIVGASKVARDITSRRRAEQQLRLLSEALEAAANGIAITDARGDILWVNPAFTALTGYSREESIGKNPRILKSGKYPREFYRRIWETILRGEPWQGEMINRRKNGTLYPEEMTITPVRAGGGEITHFVAVKQDITARKAAEEKLASLAQILAEKNRELEAIVYVASHDLRSPLVNIQGFSQELGRACQQVKQLLEGGGSKPMSEELKPLLSEDIPEALEFIQAGVAKIDALLSGFLRYSRLGRAALRIERLNMNAMLGAIAQAMEFQMKQAEATLKVGPLPDCQGDATQINQVFSNLLDNAVKYLDPKRPGRISVAGRLDGTTACYAVQDNGLGIAREHQAKVFEIFHRLDPSQGTGEGLGLTIVQRILERHGGTVRLESEPGVGTTFFISLPAPVEAK